MPPIHILLAAVAVGAALPALVWSLAGIRPAGSSVLRDQLSASIARPIRAVRKPSAMLGLVPGGYVNDLDRRMSRAGINASLTVDRYLAVKIPATVVMFFVGAYFGQKLGGGAVLMLPFITTLFAWVLPDLQLSGMANKREMETALQLPDVLDQLTISIEAGLGFDAAMARLVQTSEGPVVDQLARVLQDMRLGLARDVALRGLAERTDSPDLRTFANAMAQAGKHGLAMANVLRAQAAEAREKRKFRAEEAAHKVPVKILMPLILCILPTLFIVLIGPAVIRYNDGGFGG